MCRCVWCIHTCICVCVCAHLQMPSHVEAGDQCWFSFSTASHLFGSVFLSVSLKLKLTSFARLACQRALRICLSQPFCTGVINTQHQEITEALTVDKNRKFMFISCCHCWRYHFFLFTDYFTLKNIRYSNKLQIIMVLLSTNLVDKFGGKSGPNNYGHNTVTYGVCISERQRSAFQV